MPNRRDARRRPRSTDASWSETTQSWVGLILPAMPVIMGTAVVLAFKGCGILCSALALALTSAGFSVGAMAPWIANTRQEGSSLPSPSTPAGTLAASDSPAASAVPLPAG